MNLVMKSGNDFNVEIREKFLQMSLDEKRKYYKCSNNYVTLDNIVKIKDQMKILEKKFVSNTLDNNSSEFPILSLEEAQLFSNKISIWRGDITRLEVDAIVNAANEGLLGGGGVDGAIHSAASKLLLAECKTLNGCKTGQAKITSGYHLPANYVIHTVGPIGENHNMLESCYKSCLDIMVFNKLTTIAFPCVSTGIYGYPNEPAAKIAIKTVFEFLRSDRGKNVNRIIFTLFLDKDVIIYERLLKKAFELLNTIN